MGGARILRIALAWAGICLLSVYALRLGFAVTIVNEAQREVARWAETRVQPDLETWLRVRSDVMGAIRLSPGDPAAVETLGNLHLQRASTPHFMELAHEHLATALELRPTSPYQWANLATARYGLGWTDRVFEAALVNAIRLGPSEPEVQATVAYLGLALWDEAAPETRRAVEAAVHAGMLRNPMEMLRISERRGRLDPACRHVEGNGRITDPKWANLCVVKEKP